MLEWGPWSRDRPSNGVGSREPSPMTWSRDGSEAGAGLGSGQPRLTSARSLLEPIADTGIGRGAGQLASGAVGKDSWGWPRQWAAEVGIGRELAGSFRLDSGTRMVVHGGGNPRAGGKNRGLGAWELPSGLGDEDGHPWRGWAIGVARSRTVKSDRLEPSELKLWKVLGSVCL